MARTIQEIIVKISSCPAILASNQHYLIEWKGAILGVLFHCIKVLDVNGTNNLDVLFIQALFENLGLKAQID